MVYFQLVFELRYSHLLQVNFPFLYALKPQVFLTFSGGIEMEKWPEIG